jgi:hypothetical protein
MSVIRIIVDEKNLSVKRVFTKFHSAVVSTRPSSSALIGLNLGQETGFIQVSLYSPQANIGKFLFKIAHINFNFYPSQFIISNDPVIYNSILTNRIICFRQDE